MRTGNSWTLELASAFKSIQKLYQFLDWILPPDLEAVADTYPLLITRSLAEKIKAQGPTGVLAREFLPHQSELDQNLNQWGLMDPIGDKKFNLAPQIIHRYQNRVLFTATNTCPVHCRYCFRKNELNGPDEIFQSEFSETLSYLSAHPEINEIIFTGGDPLSLSNERLDKYLSLFSEIPSIRDIRFHTRYPVILPQRIDEGFIALLDKHAKHFRTLSMAIHSNHISEFDHVSEASIRALGASPIQLLSQTVLLKGINDSTDSLVELINQFLKLKIRPYYLHHPDRVAGGMHFYLPLEEGRGLYADLRNLLPGWALPHYVIDVPGGHGKITATNPENTSFSGQLLSLSGETISLQEPDFFI